MYKLIFSFVLSSVLFVSCKDSKTNMVRAEYSGKDISEQVSIVRDKDSKAASLKIDFDSKWALYAGNSVDSIDFKAPILEGEKGGVFPLNINDSTRTYFQLVTPESKVILADRHLPMSGGYNFRDLGGIKTTDGRYVKWGKIFRSDDLHKLTDDDLTYLSSVPLISIVDFRAQEEINQAPDRIPSSVYEDYQLCISPGNLMMAKGLKDMGFERLDSIMMELNTLLVTDTASINQYRKFFELLQNEKDVPLMFHCSAGKDRTGMGAALILFSLGVDEETILKDYLMSNTYLADKYARYITQYPNLKPLFEVKAHYLKSGIEQIKKDHGSVENYLTNVLNVDIQKMKDMYLY